MARSKKYALRLGFGHEGHGQLILVAAGDTIDDCEQAAREALEAEFGGQWPGKLRDTAIGSANWLAKHFGDRDGVHAAIAEAEVR